MRFIDDHEAEVIPRPAGAPQFPHKGLNRRYYHRCIEAGVLLAHFNVGNPRRSPAYPS
jgi:hypothetical protein